MTDFEKARDEAKRKNLVSYHSEDEAKAFDKGADWARDYFSDKTHWHELTALRVEYRYLKAKADKLAEALKLFMDCKKMKGPHLKIGLQMANEAAIEAIEFRGEE